MGESTSFHPSTGSQIWAALATLVSSAGVLPIPYFASGRPRPRPSADLI
jgi:hypothetical protein